MRTRLVLIVEPEPGFIGFELRSLQEFFAGAFLVQTAHDTEQRFERLKAIAYSEHWRNVALFCAGRIVRDFSGEAANILEICRSMDRDLPDTYLRRGAWLALDIASDGIFTTNNRNLQHSALELALSVLHRGMTSQMLAYLPDSLQRLSSEDRRDILSKLLKQKLASLPLPCLSQALRILGRFIKAQQDFIQFLEVLLSTNKQEYVLEALEIGFRYKVNPEWLAQQLERHWQLFLSKQGYLREWWNSNQQHAQKVLLALSLSEEQTSSLMDRYLLSMYFVRPYRSDSRLMENPGTYSEQFVVFLQCLRIMNTSWHPAGHGPIVFQIGQSIRIRQVDRGNILDEKSKVFTTSGLLATLDQLMERQDLMPQLRACLWAFYWQTHELTEPMVTTFLAESRAWSEYKSLLEFWELELYRFWPLLTLAVESQTNEDQHTLALLRPYLNATEENSFLQQIYEALQIELDKLSREEQLATVLSYSYTAQHFPELASIAEKLGADTNRLIDRYTALSIDSDLKLSSAVLQGVFSNIEKIIVQPQIPQIQWWPLFDSVWELDPKAIRQGLQLLEMLVARLPQQPAILQSTICLLFKLLTIDATPLLLVPTILAYLADETHLKDLPIWMLTDTLSDIPEEHLTRLANYTIHEDAKVRQGALTLWAELIEMASKRAYAPSKRQLSKLKVLSFDWGLGLSLIKDTDTGQRKKGIMLLIYSHFPISKAQYLSELRSAMAQAQDGDEIAAWALFLENVLVRNSETKAWQKLLETLLDAPQSYSSSILTAAMERYTKLEGVAGPEIKDERALDLPVLTPPKRRRAGR